MDRELIRLKARVIGEVQGVGFRMHTMQRAAQLGLTGWVRNESDDSVTVVAEGRRSAVEMLERWLRQGPSAAEVQRVESSWNSATGEFRTFEVRYS
ncbi:MAG: acylphosphatase [Chloroflexi bacterium]|nr:acylphosphatase [Chloroflexota bacterium]